MPEKTRPCLLYAAGDEACNYTQAGKKIINETNISQTPETMLINELTVRRNKQLQEPKLSSPVCYANSDELREEFRGDL